MEKEKNKENVSEKELKDKSFHKVKDKSRFKRFKKIVLLLLILIFFFSIKAGIYIANWQSLAKDMIYNSPSSVLDDSGKVIAQIGNSKKTKNVPLSDIPDNLKNAYISIEDQRFYSHSGIDIQRTSAAILNYVKNLGSSSFGGSSITQQLVKNLTGDSSSTITRKINEWIKAFTLEGVLEKDEILQAYFNVIYVGPNIYGVELGANYYFDKKVSDLTLEECAFLAGINNAPNSYNPFENKDNYEKIKSRTKTVLYKMNELGYISKESYDSACKNVDAGLNFKQGKIDDTSKNNIYSYHTDSLLNEIIKDVSEKKNISMSFANNYIEMAGLKIYSTQNTNIQNLIEQELSKPKYIIKSQKDSSVTAQAAMVVMNHTNGQILGCVRWNWKKRDIQRIK